MSEEESAEASNVPAIIKFKEIVTSDYAKSQFAPLLQTKERVERFLRIVVSMGSRNPDLLDCDINSVVSCAMQGAQLNLDPDPVLGQFYLIPRKNVCTFMLGYQGMIQLALRSQKVRSVIGRVAYVQDEFEAVEGTNGYIRHKRNIDLPGPPDAEADFRAAYAVAHFTRRLNEPDDFEFVVLPKWKVNQIREKFSKGSKKETSPWVTAPDAMRAKTAVRALFKFLQVSAEMQLAIALDEAVDDNLDQDLSVSFKAPRSSSASKLQGLAANLAAKNGKEPEPSKPEPAEEVSEGVTVDVTPEPKKPDPVVEPEAEPEPPRCETPEPDSTEVVEDWRDPSELAAAIDSLRKEVGKAAGTPPTPQAKAKLKVAVARCITDSLGIFGYESIESMPKCKWAEFRDLLLTNIAGLGTKIGEGGEAEIRRRIYVKTGNAEAAKAAVAKMVAEFEVDSLSAITVRDMDAVESFIRALPKEESK